MCGSATVALPDHVKLPDTCSKVNTLFEWLANNYVFLIGYTNV